MNKLLLSMLIAGVMTGCASFPDDYQKEVTVPDIAAEMSDAWSATPAIRYVNSAAGVTVRKYFDLPAEISSRPLKLSFGFGAEASVADLLHSLAAQGYRVVSRLGDSQNTPLEVRSFNGTLGEFLGMLSQVQNIDYEYRNGVLFILEASRYSVSLPQHADLLDQVAISLEDMGASDVRTDLLAGLVYYQAKPDISDYIREYLDRISKNSAMVQLQIAVITVGLNRDLDQGFDWSALGAQRGTRDLRPGVTGGLMANSGSNGNTGGYNGNGGINNGGGNNNGNNNGNNGNGSGQGSGGGVEAAAAAIGSALTFTGSSGLGFVFNNDSFSLTAAIKALSTYGNARTEQNVVLGTVSGMPVKISSGNDIPYVKSIGSSTASGGSTSGSTDTQIIRSGLELDVTPNFDSSDNSVVTTVKVAMSSLVGFRELSAGINLGTLSQPEMQNLEFENVGRLRAGETTVVGGITYDQLTRNYNNLPGLETLPTGSSSSMTKKHAIYIVVRPTVTIFTQNADFYNQRIRTEPLNKVGAPADASAAPVATVNATAPVAVVAPVGAISVEPIPAVERIVIKPMPLADVVKGSN